MGRGPSESPSQKRLPEGAGRRKRYLRESFEGAMGVDGGRVIASKDTAPVRLWSLPPLVGLITDTEGRGWGRTGNQGRWTPSSIEKRARAAGGEVRAMSAITSKRVLRYQGVPGGKFRAKKETAYRDLAARRIRVMLNARWEFEHEPCCCEPAEYEFGRRITNESVCAAHRWFGFRVHDRGRFISRYARLLRRADERGELKPPTATEAERWPLVASFWNVEDGCATWSCACSEVMTTEDAACLACLATKPPPMKIAVDDEVPF